MPEEAGGSHVTVANYEYLVYWRLYQDGSIETEVRATGIMVTTQFPEGRQPPYGAHPGGDDCRANAAAHARTILFRQPPDARSLEPLTLSGLR